MMKTLATIAIFSSLALAGCSKDNKTATKQDTAAIKKETKRADSHAPANAEPGSHEDWCGEHSVPESQCTRCNPGLVAAFKATGDWCDEHGLPESQCLKCNPELKIVRPPPSEPAKPQE